MPIRQTLQLFLHITENAEIRTCQPALQSIFTERVEEINPALPVQMLKNKEGYPLIRRMRDVMDGTFTLALIGEEFKLLGSFLISIVLLKSQKKRRTRNPASGLRFVKTQFIKCSKDSTNMCR
ncbi:MAG: hypothetical protein U0Y68_22530 [Blastocatellia bacterium]